MLKENIHNLRCSIFDKLSKLSHNDDNVICEEDVSDDTIIEELSYILDTKNISILYVDDEPINLKFFSYCLNRDFNIFLAHDTDLALDILKKEKIDIIVTDYIMPNLTGTEFLSQIKNTFKDTPPFIILSAHIENDELIKEVKKIEVFKLLNKPFNIDEMKKSIKDAYIYNLGK